MRAGELRPIFTQIIQKLPFLRYYKSLLFVYPIDMMLRGIDMDPSAFSRDRFNMCAFYMPLCVPSDHLHFAFGARIYHADKDWSMLMPDLIESLTAKIIEEALPFLLQAPTLRDFAATPSLYVGNPHGPKAAAYALARIGDTRKAVEMIESYLPRLDLSSHWQKQIDEESRALRHLLIYEPALAAAKLVEWENETIRNLGLERFR